MTPITMLHDPAACPHEKVLRIGIQRSLLGPDRLYLVTCRRCSTTITTRTLRERREAERPGKRATA